MTQLGEDWRQLGEAGADCGQLGPLRNCAHSS